jgi:hypothetical protein
VKSTAYKTPILENGLENRRYTPGFSLLNFASGAYSSGGLREIDESSFTKATEGNGVEKKSQDRFSNSLIPNPNINRAENWRAGKKDHCKGAEASRRAKVAATSRRAAKSFDHRCRSDAPHRCSRMWILLRC